MKWNDPLKCNKIPRLQKKKFWASSTCFNSLIHFADELKFLYPKQDSDVTGNAEFRDHISKCYEFKTSFC